MFTKTRQQKFFHKRANSALSNLNAYCQSRYGIHLHRLRVDIKKMNALLHILKGHPDDGQMLKAFRPVRAVYKKTGEIRMLDVYIKLMAKVPLSDPLFMVRQNQIRDAKAGKFIAASQKHKLILKTCLGKIAAQSFDAENKFFKTKFKKQLKKIAKVIAQHPGEIDRLHKIRKKIKMLVYTYAIFPKAITKQIHFNTKYLSNIEKTIGDWHDLVQAAGVLLTAGIATSPHYLNLNLQQKEQELVFKKRAKGFLKKAQTD